MPKLEKAINAIDDYNRKDPNTTNIFGEEVASELLYSRRMTEKLITIAPDASDHLKIAARAQHIGRWSIPREKFPMDRIGYLKWREKLKKFHALKTGEILSEVGYNDKFIEKTTNLIKKKQIKRNPETQTLEDVICLVFLENYYDDFLKTHTEDKTINILKKTWYKMSEKGRSEALKLNLSEKGLFLIHRALDH